MKCRFGLAAVEWTSEQDGIARIRPEARKRMRKGSEGTGGRLGSRVTLGLFVSFLGAVSTEGASLQGGIDYAKWIGPGRLEVAGWVADMRDGAPVSRLDLRLDGRAIGQARLGLERPDVSTTLRRKDYLRSGWLAQVDIKGFRPGRFRLTATARSRRGETQQLGPETFIDIPGFSGPSPPAGPSSGLEGSVDLVRLSPSGRNLDVAGWAADRRTGAPIAKVEVRLNDRVVALARVGVARQDVAGAFRRSDYLYSGWTAQIDVAGFRPGIYTVSVYASSAAGEKLLLPSTARTVRLRY